MLLRNRFQEIRDVARGTLVKIIETLGFRYLQYLLKEMQSVLVKGYQVNASEQKEGKSSKSLFSPQVLFTLLLLMSVSSHQYAIPKYSVQFRYAKHMLDD